MPALQTDSREITYSGKIVLRFRPKFGVGDGLNKDQVISGANGSVTLIGKACVVAILFSGVIPDKGQWTVYYRYQEDAKS